MITRIVRMTFRPEETDAFLAIFNASKTKIRNFPGCLHLELHRDAHETNVYYTLSHWQDTHALEAYRHSELFAETWRKTRALFAAPATAFSLVNEMVVNPA